jgi:alpha-glucosidase (family GH31 glycosyl hydrolase)
MAGLLLFSLAVLLSSGAASSSPIGYGYKLVALDRLNRGDGVVGHLELIRATETFGPDIKHLKLVARYQSGDRLQVHISDADSKRYEVPQELLPRDAVDSNVKPGRRHLGRRIKVESSGKLSNSKHQLEFHYIANPFGFAVVRRSNGEVLFNTSAPESNPAFNNMIFKDQYLEISSQLPFKSALYGLGESTRPDGLRLSHNRQYTMWATDVGSWNIDIDLYGTFPFVMEMREGGLAHGVTLMNSNGMDIDYNDTSITFKIIGGLLDFYFFPGSSPLDVVDQLTQLVGRPAAMPYWVLGFHQSRYGYQNVEQLESVVRKYAEVKLPVESMWSDIDHMDRYMDFTLDPVNYPIEKLAPFVENLHKNHQKFIMILDPGIKIDSNYSTYIRGDKLDIFMRNETRDRYVAQVWPGATNIPDFLHPKAQEFWSTEVTEFNKVIPFDGLWLDMNEPANFCSGPTCFYPEGNVHQTCPKIDECCMVCDNRKLNRWDDPPYHINGLGIHRPLYGRTMAMSCEHWNGIRAYDTHNVYGMSETIATYSALKEMNGKRPFVLGRSMFLGSGAYAAHWTGDNGASWGDLQYSIVSIINSGMFGVPMVGADICGFNEQTTEELCIRWAQVGAFYPFSRDHSDIHFAPQEFYLWESVTETARSVFAMRYKLLPFLYTLMYGAHKTGAPIFRPLFFAVPSDPETWSISDQFLLGTDILVSPVVKSETYSVEAYFPAGVWYNLFNPSQVIKANNSYHLLPAPIDTVNAHVRSGSIVPMQEFAFSTTEARKTPYTLLIAMDPFDSASIVDARATGELFIDDDDTILMEIKEGTGTFVKFEATRSSHGQYVLRSIVEEGAYALKQGLVLQTISVLGVQAPPTLVSVNGKGESVKVVYDGLGLTLTNLNLSIGKSFEMAWDSAGNAALSS